MRKLKTWHLRPPRAAWAPWWHAWHGPWAWQRREVQRLWLARRGPRRR